MRWAITGMRRARFTRRSRPVGFRRVKPLSGCGVQGQGLGTKVLQARAKPADRALLRTSSRVLRTGVRTPAHAATISLASSGRAAGH